MPDLFAINSDSNMSKAAVTVRLSESSACCCHAISVDARPVIEILDSSYDSLREEYELVVWLHFCSETSFRWTSFSK